jgi:hypothetical protein
VSRIEPPDIRPAEPLHQAEPIASFRQCQQQVDVVVHEHIGVKPAFRRVRSLPKQPDVQEAILIIEEAGQAVVAALHDVLRNAGQVESGKSGHAGIPAGLAVSRHRTIA